MKSESGTAPRTQWTCANDAEADPSYAFWKHSIVVVLMKINVRKRVVSIKSLTVLEYRAPRDHSNSKKTIEASFFTEKFLSLLKSGPLGGVNKSSLLVFDSTNPETNQRVPSRSLEEAN